ncbi:MAG: hypothetical protein NT023_19020 [Armatimonadetes bacterium]|nr:hypothetical protein [Armatimonadota bacterium]
MRASGFQLEDLFQSKSLTCKCLGLERLIFVKRAVGRPKDLEALAELEAMLESQL